MSAADEVLARLDRLLFLAAAQQFTLALIRRLLK